MQRLSRLEPWPQAHKSDPRENAWHKKLCNGTLTLKQAQKLELAYQAEGTARRPAKNGLGAGPPERFFTVGDELPRPRAARPRQLRAQRERH